MSDSKLPTEVELVYEVMPCNAMRTMQEPLPGKHPCTYFRKWGTYHSFDYLIDGPQPDPLIPQTVNYLGRAPLIPEIMSGCRKVPILALGINPNLPGWFARKRSSLNPLFDDYKQYAHYFRYRSTNKLILKKQDYEAYGGGDQDTPFSSFELNVPRDHNGHRKMDAIVDPQTMYRGYQGLLTELAQRMHWKKAALSLSEDMGYMNMVACPSAKWRITPDPTDAALPPMTIAERDGIVSECFNERKYFFRQLFQTLPTVIMVFSQSTATPFISAMQGNFTKGNPKKNEAVKDLLERHITLRYGILTDGTKLDARVIFSPHISGDADNFKALREKVLQQLVDEAKAGGLTFNTSTKHLARPRGGCTFCPMLQIGPCPYETELKPISIQTGILADVTTPASIQVEKKMQADLLDRFLFSPTKSDDWIEDDKDKLVL